MSTPKPRKTLRDLQDFVAGLIFRIEGGYADGRPATLGRLDLDTLHDLHHALLEAERERVRASNFRR